MGKYCWKFYEERVLRKAVSPMWKKQKIEYMTTDLSPSWSLDSEKKHLETIEKLNKLGDDGWILISGMENLKYATFIRIIYCED